MITKKKEAVELLQQYKALFASYIGKELTLSWNVHSYDGVIIKDITQITLQNVKTKPNKREYEGRQKSPMMFQIETNQGNLVFVFDDTIVSPLVNGIRLTVALDKPLNGANAIEVDLRET